MPGSLTTRDRQGTRIARPSVLPSATNTASVTTFAAQWLAYAIPCQRFARHLAVTHA